MTSFRYSKGLNHHLDYSGDEEEREEVEEEQECYECGMMVRKHQLRSPGCTYCQPEEERKEQP